MEMRVRFTVRMSMYFVYKCVMIQTIVDDDMGVYGKEFWQHFVVYRRSSTKNVAVLRSVRKRLKSEMWARRAFK